MSDQEAWLIRFEDAGMRPEVFTGQGAEEAARARFAALNDNWTVTLFRSIDAAIGEPAAEQDTRNGNEDATR